MNINENIMKLKHNKLYYEVMNEYYDVFHWIDDGFYMNDGLILVAGYRDLTNTEFIKSDYGSLFSHLKDKFRYYSFPLPPNYQYSNGLSD